MIGERKTRRLLWGLVFLSILSGCSKGYLEDTIFGVFDSYLTLRLYDSSKNEKLASIETEYRRLSKKMDAFSEADSPNIHTLNSTNEAVDFADDGAMASFLRDCLFYQKETDGYFNILIGNLTSLWKTALAKETLPDEKAIQDAVEECNDTAANYLSFDGSKVTRHGSATIDLGAIGKGYALKQIAKDCLQKEKYYFVDAGSSSVLLGEKNGGESFSVGLKDVENAYLSLKDVSIGTSGISEQKTVLDGVTYSHIVNPKTGSAKSSLAMAMALGEDSALTDVLSTVFMVVGAGAIEGLADKFGVSYLYYDGAKIVCSPSLKVFYH